MRGAGLEAVRRPSRRPTHTIITFLPRNAMHNAAYALVQWRAGWVFVTFVYCVETAKIRPCSDFTDMLRRLISCRIIIIIIIIIVAMECEKETQAF